MSILSVANVHFESTGANRIEFDAPNNAINIVAPSKLKITAPVIDYSNPAYDATSPSFTSVASGPIDAGSVLVLNSNGTVSSVRSANNFIFTENNKTSTVYISTVYLPNTSNFVIFYTDFEGSSVAKAIVGQYSNLTSSISFGQPVIISSNTVSGLSTALETTNNKIVLTYTDASGNNASNRRGMVRVANVSGNVISFSQPQQFGTNGNVVSTLATVYHPGKNRVIIFFNDFNNNDSKTSYRYSIGNLGASSNNDINISTRDVLFESTNVFTSFHVAYNFDQQNINFATLNATRTQLEMRSANLLNSTHLTIGSRSIAQPTSVLGNALLYHSGIKKHIFLHDTSDTTINYFQLWESSNLTTNLTASNVAVVTAYAGSTVNPIKEKTIIYNGTQNNFIIFFRDSSSRLFNAVYEVSDNVITTNTVAKISDPVFSDGSVLYDSVNNKFILAYFSGFSSVANKGYTKVISPGESYRNISTNVVTNIYTGGRNNGENVVGMAKENYSNGQNVIVYTYGSVISNLSNLQTGKKHYIYANGQFSTETDSVNEVSQSIGLALSANSLLFSIS